ncbi:putative spermidine/putrescine transport system permease protein [Mycobacterium frederiksbergense]|uniref:Spermidine/putrescine transport system permease protein n=1 Tax=Mycolicibacterium frederiksbergense TaxID=117567 RepID=A0ABT6L8L4_9MYCO|nr:ABC transporter permease subunit [Mycolicibacterium frederiksbergense]MDH6199297.1 putative spermidine/putrescine transport system permease protein [Mycolicibacterium frederiksbergense]
MSATLNAPERQEQQQFHAALRPETTGGSVRTSGRSARWRKALDLLPTLPYFTFVGLFLVVPVIITTARAFTGKDGRFTLDNFAQLGEEQYVTAFANSLNISLVTSLIGAVLGLILGWALVNATRPAWLHQLVTSLSAVASQMGGPPLAYMFIAFMGAQGMLTTWLRDLLGFNLSQTIPIASFWGIVCAYLYFQIPLMAILSIPALQGVRKEWVDGGLSLGASRTRILFTVTLPILAPSIIGGFLLLFANAFSGYAAAYSMAGSAANLVPILIGFFLSGNVLVNQGLASALITGMVAIMLVAMGLRGILLKRATKWSQ